MYNIFVRLNTVFFFWTSVLFFLSAGCSLTSFFFETSPKVEFNVNTLEHFVYLPKQRAEIAYMSFDMDADLRSVFNWNVKQIFVWVTAEYETERYGVNQVVLWDDIIERKKDSYVQLINEKIEYELVSFERELKSVPLNITVNWEVMPVVGILKTQGGGSSNTFHFTLPDDYSNRKSKKEQRRKARRQAKREAAKKATEEAAGASPDHASEHEMGGNRLGGDEGESEAMGSLMEEEEEMDDDDVTDDPDEEELDEEGDYLAEDEDADILD